MLLWCWELFFSPLNFRSWWGWGHMGCRANQPVLDIYVYILDFDGNAVVPRLAFFNLLLGPLADGGGDISGQTDALPCHFLFFFFWTLFLFRFRFADTSSTQRRSFIWSAWFSLVFLFLLPIQRWGDGLAALEKSGSQNTLSQRGRRRRILRTTVAGRRERSELISSMFE